MTPIRLRRRGHPEWAPAPVRCVHLGLGGFFRSHTAWYTARAVDADVWGHAAFSGQSRALVDGLAAQDGLYTLTTRRADGDTIEVVPSVVEMYPGTDTVSWRRTMSSPSVEVVTLTVTEAAYRPGPASVAVRLVDGLAARRTADAGPISVVPCDNVADNAVVLARAVRAEAEQRGDGLAAWCDESVAFIGTVVDRITPRPVPVDVDAAAARGYVDAVPVVTEPFTEWVFSGSFAAGRPDWESAGALVVDDLTPYTRRKLHLLNGAHSLLAYAGLLRGHAEVADAATDPDVAELVETWWDEAAATVGGDVDVQTAYRQVLVDRFANPAMHHRLDQIAIDGSVKLAMRVVPVVRSQLATNASTEASAQIVGAWIAFVRRVGGDLIDARRDEVLAAAQGPVGDAVRRAIFLLDADLVDDDEFVSAVGSAVGRVGG